MQPKPIKLDTADIYVVEGPLNRYRTYFPTEPFCLNESGIHNYDIKLWWI